MSEKSTEIRFTTALKADSKFIALNKKVSESQKKFDELTDKLSKCRERIQTNRAEVEKLKPQRENRETIGEQRRLDLKIEDLEFLVKKDENIVATMTAVTPLDSHDRDHNPEKALENAGELPIANWNLRQLQIEYQILISGLVETVRQQEYRKSIDCHKSARAYEVRWKETYDKISVEFNISNPNPAIYESTVNFPRGWKAIAEEFQQENLNSIRALDVTSQGGHRDAILRLCSEVTEKAREEAEWKMDK